MNDESSNSHIMGLLGEIKTEVRRLVGMEERLRTVETTLTTLLAKQKTSAPWWVVTGAIVGVITALATLVGLFFVMATLIGKINGVL